MSECSTSTTVGETLIQSLNEMVADGSMTEAAANAIQDNFQHIFPKVMDEVMNDPVHKKPLSVHIEGKLLTYNNLGEMWRIDTRDCKLMTNNARSGFDIGSGSGSGNGPYTSAKDGRRPQPKSEALAATIACGLRNSDRSRIRLRSEVVTQSLSSTTCNSGTVTSVAREWAVEDSDPISDDSTGCRFIDLGSTSIIMTEKPAVERLSRKRTRLKT